MSGRTGSVSVGFMPLLDSAPLVVAAELGFADREGLELRLVRETSWANLRDRLMVGQFDAAQMLGPMVVASAMGLGPMAVPLVAPMALGRGGNAITVSMRLWNQMRSAGAELRGGPRQMGRALADVVRRRHASGSSPLTMAMVFPYSCHNYQLRHWLSWAGVDPDRDVRLVVLPPPLLVDALRTGQVDAYCVGEPWNSMAVEAGLGVMVVMASELWRRPPEKVLAVREAVAGQGPDWLPRLVRALHAACRWCAQAEHRDELAALLSEPRHVGAPGSLLRRLLEQQIRCHPEGEAFDVPGFIDLGSGDATQPWPEHARWYAEQMQRWGQLAGPVDLDRAGGCFRPALLGAALGEERWETGLAEGPRTELCRLFDAWA